MDMRMLETAHDMKMPIQLICSCAQMLEMQPAIDDNAALYLKMLVESAQELKSMVLSVLDESADCVCWGNCDIIEETRSVIRRFALSAREKAVSIGLSANARSFVMQTDALKLRRLMQNLVANALKATQVGGRIEVCVNVCGDAVDIGVSDNGRGIPPDRLPQIFQVGFTTDGYGYGLSIVHKYARLLGGCVYVDSKENVGSNFSVHLPVLQAKVSV